MCKFLKHFMQTSSSGGGGEGYVKLLKLCRFLSSLLVKLVQVRERRERGGEKLVHHVGSTLVSNPQEFQEDSLEFASDIAGLLIHLYGWVCSGSGPCATLPTLSVCVCPQLCSSFSPLLTCQQPHSV